MLINPIDQGLGPQHISPIARQALQCAAHHGRRAVVCLEAASTHLHGALDPDRLRLAREHAVELTRLLHDLGVG